MTDLSSKSNQFIIDKIKSEPTNILLGVGYGRQKEIYDQIKSEVLSEDDLRKAQNCFDFLLHFDKPLVAFDNWRREEDLIERAVFWCQRNVESDECRRVLYALMSMAREPSVLPLAQKSLDSHKFDVIANYLVAGMMRVSSKSECHKLFKRYSAKKGSRGYVLIPAYLVGTVGSRRALEAAKKYLKTHLDSAISLQWPVVSDKRVGRKWFNRFARTKLKNEESYSGPGQLEGSLRVAINSCRDRRLYEQVFGRKKKEQGTNRKSKRYDNLADAVEFVTDIADESHPLAMRRKLDMMLSIHNEVPDHPILKEAYKIKERYGTRDRFLNKIISLLEEQKTI